MPNHSSQNLARTIWWAYGHLSLPRFCRPERLTQAGSRNSRRTKMQITFLQHAVVPHLVASPFISLRNSQLAKVLQQGSQLVLKRIGQRIHTYAATPSILTKPHGKSSA